MCASSPSVYQASGAVARCSVARCWQTKAARTLPRLRSRTASRARRSAEGGSGQGDASARTIRRSRTADAIQAPQSSAPDRPINGARRRMIPSRSREPSHSSTISAAVGLRWISRSASTSYAT